MSNLLADLRLAFRGLRRSPLFATVATASLALGKKYKFQPPLEPGEDF